MSKTPTRNRHAVTIKELAQELMPDWNSDEWFYWPPDIFALTSILLSTTGIYRFVVSPHPATGKRLKCEWGIDEKRESVETEVGQWAGWLSGATDKMPQSLQTSRDILFESTVPIDLDGEELPEPLCVEILRLHALADVICANFGFPSISSNPLYLLANFFLEMTGTLSRVPKRLGVVLPKMRAPQTGLTIRSLSHNLTFHRSEVKVNWRTIPWVNQNYNTVNIMVVPVPYEVNPHAFRPCNYPRQEEEPKKFRYFEYTPAAEVDIDEVVRLLRAAYAKVTKVHVLVFPELALSVSDLRKLKDKLVEEFEPHRIPMLISGVRGDDGAGGGTRPGNQVMLSVFFANKWYDIGQDKHHRWRVDSDQIKQYSLACLSLEGSWWEGINLDRRALTFISPNAWLTLCPLICEDLAQLDPVSALIRGVGPTLVVAILMDGPQLPERWSARYVGVLADDPGTSILTVTSLGMALQSKARGKPENRTVALWKDKETGAEAIEMKPDARAVLLTVTADWKEEFTADGRSDGRSAATFILRGVHNLRPKERGPQHDEKPEKGSASRPHESTPSDVQELSVLCYLTSAVVDASAESLAAFRDYVLVKDSTVERRIMKKFRPFPDLWERIQSASHKNFDVTKERVWPKGQFEHAVTKIFDFMMSVNFEEAKDTKERPGAEEKLRARIARWGEMVRKAKAELLNSRDLSPRAESADVEQDGLDPTNIKRLNDLVYLSILWAVYNRVREAIKEEDEFSRLQEIDYQLMKEIEKLLEEYSVSHFNDGNDSAARRRTRPPARPKSRRRRTEDVRSV